MDRCIRKNPQNKMLWISKLFLCFVVAYLFALTESVWINSIRFLDGVPMPTLTFCICLSLYTPPMFGFVVSAVCGLCMDFAKGFPVGFDSLLYVCISAVCVRMKRWFYFRRIYQVMAAIFFGTLLYGGLASVLYSLWLGVFSLKFLWKNAVYSALIAPIFYGFLCRKEV